MHKNFDCRVRMESLRALCYDRWVNMLRVFCMSPYQKVTWMTYVKRGVLSVLLFSLSLFQITGCISDECDTEMLWKIIPTILVTMIYLIKYVTFIVNLDRIKVTLQLVRNDWLALKDEAEIKVMSTSMKTATYWHTFFLYTMASLAVFVLTFNSLTLIHSARASENGTQSKQALIEMDYFLDKNKYFYITIIHLNILASIGQTIFSITEGLVLSFVFHLLGLFHIASYRLKRLNHDLRQLSVGNTKRTIHEKISNIACVHRRCNRFIQAIVDSMTLSYFCLIAASVIIVAVCCFRIRQAIIMAQRHEMTIPLVCGAFNLVYLFIGNFVGQKVIDCNERLSHHLYNSLDWYNAPVNMQKLLLYIMMKSLKHQPLNLFGIFIASYEGFFINSEISLFETNIRFMGSLLACYALTGDVMFRDKAAQLGERMLPAFQTETGIPHSLINLHTGASKNYGWASSGCSILSEIGTMHLEFTYLSDITGNPVFKIKVENVRKVLKELDKPKGLYPNYIHPKTGKWGQHHMSLGGLGDSFYEYLLKAWIQSGKEDVEARQMYDDAIAAINQHMIKMSPGQLLYVSDLKYDRLEHKMGHLACFAGGMFALGAKTLQNELSERYMTVAAGLTNTCHESYDRSYTKLGPEAFHFIEGNEAKSLKNGEKYYILRPETFESYFVMWRLTKDPKYREWGWEAVQALEKYCRVPGGFTGLHNVYLSDPPQDDVQQSYFFAETLKYLYLLFSDDDLINLDDWVFNSEAHVLPIRGSPLYRPSPAL